MTLAHTAPKTHAKAVSNKERQAKALELRKAGATYQQISDQLGYSNYKSAARSVKTALERLVREPAEELRNMELERLNHMLLTLWPRVQGGEYPAIDRAIRIGERIAALTGYDRVIPTTVSTTNVILIEGTQQDYIQGLKALKKSAEDLMMSKTADDGVVIEVEAIP